MLFVVRVPTTDRNTNFHDRLSVSPKYTRTKYKETYRPVGEPCGLSSGVAGGRTHYLVDPGRYSPAR